MTDPRRCVECGRIQDDVLHGPERSGAAGRPHPPGRIAHHEYAPAERRVAIRRMADRIRAVQVASGQAPGIAGPERRRSSDRRAS